MGSEEEKAEFDKMVGKKLVSLFISDGEGDLGFVFEDGAATRWEAIGDCCSTSWFADIVGVSSLLGASIRSIQEIDMDALGYMVEDGRGRDESDEVYGYKLLTTLGWCDIVFRNSSNGYYGGEMSIKAAEPSHFKGWTAVKKDLGDQSICGGDIPAWQALKEAKALAKVVKAKKVSLSHPKPGRFKSL